MSVSSPRKHRDRATVPAHGAPSASFARSASTWSRRAISWDALFLEIGPFAHLPICLLRVLWPGGVCLLAGCNPEQFEDAGLQLGRGRQAREKASADPQLVAAERAEL